MTGYCFSGRLLTKEGIDIKELVQAAVSQSDQVPGAHKAQVKQWICDSLLFLAVIEFIPC